MLVNGVMELSHGPSAMVQGKEKDEKKKEKGKLMSVDVWSRAQR